MLNLSSFTTYIIIAILLTQVDHILYFLIKIPKVGYYINRYFRVLYKFIGELAKYFRLLNTLIHEVGHALMSLLTSGKVYQVQLFKDTSGFAITGSTGWFSRVLTSLAGYPFASVVAFLYVYLLKIGKEEWVVYSLVSLLVVSLIFWVRNWFGFIWTMFFLTGTILIYIYASEKFILMYLFLVIAILIVESLSSAMVIFWLSIKDSNNSGDAFNLSQSTYIPTIIWGSFFLIQAVYFFHLSIKYWV